MGWAFPLVTALLLGACTSQPEHEGFGQAPPPLTPSAPAAQVPSEEQAQRVVVSAPGGLLFEPETLEIRAGEVTEFEFENRDSQEHTFVVSELAVVMLAGAEQTVRTSVSIDRKNRGSFTFFCSISGHRAKGMEGRIEVRSAR